LKEGVSIDGVVVSETRGICTEKSTQRSSDAQESESLTDSKGGRKHTLGTKKIGIKSRVTMTISRTENSELGNSTSEKGGRGDSAYQRSQKPAKPLKGQSENAPH